LTAVAVGCIAVAGAGTAAYGVTVRDDTPTLRPGAHPRELANEDLEAAALQADFSPDAKRRAGDRQLTNTQVAKLHAAAVAKARKLGRATSASAFQSTWTQVGPNPIVTVTRQGDAFYSLSGRIGALVIRPSNHEFILGAAQGGIWTYDQSSGTWTPRSDDQSSLAIGALAIAPTDDSIVYAGTGEGALSGDSQAGNGILRSTDGGATWTHVSGDYFFGVSVSRLVVDPSNADHLYAAILRGRGGARRVTPTPHSQWGLWESHDAGATWTLIKKAPPEDQSTGATDIEIDPLDPNVLFASFAGDAMYKSTDGGATWKPMMNGIPAGNFAVAPTRFSIGISHPSAAHPAVLYVGFDWYEADGSHHVANVYKSTDAGASWAPTATGENDVDNVEDYCGTQCSYDNVVEVDPTDPNVVFVGGSYGYDLSPESGGIFRTTNGGRSWVNLGWDLHPDFHAVAFDPTNTKHVLIGNDGGVWFSAHRGGRPNANRPLTDVDWQDLNGTVDPATGAVLHRTGLAITQFTSIANAPSVPPGTDSERFWGGTQDNGTQRKSVNSATWFDVSSGDGGQVLVDPSQGSPNNDCAFGACFVYGTYFGVSPYRYTDGGASFFSNQSITVGINTSDRSEFYVPFTMNQNNPEQLFLGTYRLYRTDDARETATWHAISGDLSTGCPGTAPNGARGCFISAIGVGGGSEVYVGTDDGLVWYSEDAQTSLTPTWVKVTRKPNGLPNRPVSDFAVDRSNERIAYIAYNGYSAATPANPGHVFATTDGGRHWTNASGNLPDVPVNSLQLDPSYAGTIYAGTDVGPMVTYDGGAHWAQLGSTLPTVAVWQLNLDPLHRILVSGTHGRGAYRLADNGPAVPALVVSKVDAGVPVGPSSNLDYTITVRNIGNGDATGVTITDPLPKHTTFVSADNGGTESGGVVTFSGLMIPSGGSVAVHLTVQIDPKLRANVVKIKNDGVRVASAEGPSTTGSAVVTTIAPAYGVRLTPPNQTDGARAGSSVTYPVTVVNIGFTPDSYTLSSSGGRFAVSFLDATCTTPQTTTPTVAPGASTTVCVKVDVPADTTDNETNVATVTATSVGDPSVSASTTVTTLGVTDATLLVDEDGNSPDVQSYYADALTAAGIPFDTWDLGSDATLPAGYLNAHANVVWFTGNSYPGPLLPYEDDLTTYLNGGGHLLMSGQDILDQAAGTTAFVRDYLHVTWDGTEAQNDKLTNNVHGVSGNPVTDGIGTVPLDLSVLGDAFMDQITPNGGAQPAFTDDASQPDALSYADSSGYKVVFAAFPIEEYGTAADKADLMSRVMAFFSS
jgi:uncharacterized repeat protein (TIGR01451 family)